MLTQITLSVPRILTLYLMITSSASLSFSVAGNSELPVRLGKLLNACKNVSFL